MKKVLEMYAAVISEERAKSFKKKKALAKSKKRKAKVAAMSDSDSSVSSQGSIHAMTKVDMPRLKAQLAKTKRTVRFNGVKSKKSDESTEEKTYKETIESLGEKRDADENPESI